MLVVFPTVDTVLTFPVKVVPSTVHFANELAVHKLLGSCPLSPVFPSRARDWMLGGNVDGKETTELDETRRVVIKGSEAARSEVRAVRELYERSLEQENEREGGVSSG